MAKQPESWLEYALASIASAIVDKDHARERIRKNVAGAGHHIC